MHDFYQRHAARRRSLGGGGSPPPTKRGQLIRLVAAAAFRGMEQLWDEDWKRRYERVLAAADEVVFVSDTPGRAAFMERNRYMVDRAARLIAVYSGGGGGTRETMRYAEHKHRKVIRYDRMQA